MLKSRVSLIMRILVVAAPLAVGLEHFLHEAQPLGRGSDIPGYDHVAGRSLADIPKSEFGRSQNESELGYVSRITKTVHNATYHCLPTDNSLSLVESVVSFFAKAAGYDTAYELGLFDFNSFKCGFCSERALALAKVLSDNGFDASAFAFNGHVISKFSSGGDIFYADADYGVGPYLSGLDFKSIKDIYVKSAIPKNADLVASIVANSKDGRRYLDDDYFDGLQLLRNTVSCASDIFAALLILLSMFMVWLLFGAVSSRDCILGKSFVKQK